MSTVAHTEDPFTPSLTDLGTALAAGNARYSSSPVEALQPHGTTSLKRLERKLSHTFSNLQDIQVGGRSIVHSATGLIFTDVSFGKASYLVGCDTVPGYLLQPDRPVEVTSGTCLFGSNSFAGYTGSAAVPLTEPLSLHNLHSPIASLSIDERLHVYEAETIARLGSFINNLTSQFHAPVTVYFHEPVPEYELYGIDLYARGLLNQELLGTYLDVVRRRGPLIKNLMHAQLRVSHATLRFVSPMAWVDELNLSRLPACDIPAAVNSAGSQQDALWSALLASRPCQKLTDLNYLSYIYAYFSQAQRAHDIGAQHIFVENPDETKIYANAEQLQDAVGIGLEPACGFYVHPQVVVSRTAFDLDDHVLYDCQNGTDPRNIEIALRAYSTDAAQALLQYAHGIPENTQTASGQNRTPETV